MKRLAQLAIFLFTGLLFTGFSFAAQAQDRVPSETTEVSNSFPSVAYRKDDFSGEESYALSSQDILPKGYYSGVGITLVGVFDKAACLGVLVNFHAKDWLFIEDVQIKIGEAPPITLAISSPASRDVGGGLIFESLILPCDGNTKDIFGILKSSKNETVLLRVSGKKGQMTIEVPPSWVVDMLRLGVILKKGVTPVNVKHRL